MKRKCFKKLVCKWAPFISLFLLFLYFHLIIPVGWGDDEFFAEAIQTPLREYLSIRYATWTSRLIIEIILVRVLQLPQSIWAVTDSLMMVISAHSLLSIIHRKADEKSALLISLFVLMYRFEYMSSAGWITTTVNYTWSLASCLYAVATIAKIVRNESIGKLRIGLTIAATLFASNLEQTCGVLICVFGGYYLYCFQKKRKTHWLVNIQTIMAMASILFILTCPGNRMRFLENTEYWYPAYSGFSVLQKGFLGLTSMIGQLTIYRNWIYLFFSFILAYHGIKGNGIPTMIRLVSLVPALMLCAMQMFHTDFSSAFPGLMEILDRFYEFIGGTPLPVLSDRANKIIAIVSLIVIVSSALPLYWIVERDIAPWAILAVLTGFLSRFALGFSPTVFASVMRISIFLDFSLLLACLYMLYYARETVDSKYAVLFAIPISALSYCNLMCLIT